MTIDDRSQALWFARCLLLLVAALMSTHAAGQCTEVTIPAARAYCQASDHVKSPCTGVILVPLGFGTWVRDQCPANTPDGTTITVCTKGCVSQPTPVTAACGSDDGPTSNFPIAVLTPANSCSPVPPRNHDDNPIETTCDTSCEKGNYQGGSPINFANGNVWISQTDYSVPGLGGGLRVERTWNSLIGYVWGMFGYGGWPILSPAVGEGWGFSFFPS